MAGEELMKSLFGSGRTRLTFLLLFLASLLPAVRAQAPLAKQQAPSAKQSEREKLIAAAREIMATARYCALITVDSSGRAQARTVDPFPPDKNLAVWLATNPRTRKVAEIRRNPRVTLYYFDRESQAYVTIHGIARLVNDPKEKAKRWKDEWKDFYPDRTKDYLLIAVTPEKLEVVNVTKGILGDPKTWKPPSVNLLRKPR
jgi:general stress protein 26